VRRDAQGNDNLQDLIDRLRAPAPAGSTGGSSAKIGIPGHPAQSCKA